ncbi:hypothetical protein BV20DRAFT_989452 [Pilatotrama ljubarskyi]|nr:hypothetical protein BV20DRAFT_989452 [Pilatotrama ljubarskyi]
MSSRTTTMMDDIGEALGMNACRVESKLNHPSACFAVLACDELLRNILLHLTEPLVDDPDEGRQALASLALVCKAISPLALATLWERLDSINPIIALWESLDADDVPTRRARMIHYTRYIRDIEVDSGTVPSSLLADAAPPLFPNLRQLRWVVPSRAAIQPFSALIVPSLTEVRVDVTSDASPAQDADFLATLLDGMGAINRRCALLRTMEISWVNGPLLPPSFSLPKMLSSLLSLRSLSTSTNTIASRQTLPDLSTLPSLRSLHICHLSETHLGDVNLVAANSGFDALQSFSLEGPPLLVHDILECMPRCGVQQCTVALHGNTPERYQRLVVEDIARKFGASLDTLSLSFPSDAYSLDPGAYTPLSVSVFPTLRTLNLVDVRLTWLAPGDVSDALCEELAASWPRLRVLHLRPNGVSLHPPPSIATLRGLRHFAERCPDLEEVALQLNASGEHWKDEAERVATKRVARPVSLDLTTSLVTHPEGVAVYLKRCFQGPPVVRFNRVEARMCGLGGRVAAWDRLCALLSDDAA